MHIPAAIRDVAKDFTIAIMTELDSRITQEAEERLAPNSMGLNAVTAQERRTELLAAQAALNQLRARTADSPGRL